MELDKRIEEILLKYQNKFAMLLDDLRCDLLELSGLEEVAVEEVALGEARKRAILKECMQIDGLMRQNLSQIAKKYGRQAGTLGVYFRPDVNLLKATGAHGRAVTEKGQRIVQEYNKRFGLHWEEQIMNILSDFAVSDSTKVKLKLNNIHK
ncbi:MAG TPA: hypothetical protein VEB00_05620 [Clostridia bacterium]|nr:hypothetical protein [Clostridia bacterium]